MADGDDGRCRDKEGDGAVGMALWEWRCCEIKV